MPSVGPSRSKCPLSLHSPSFCLRLRLCRPGTATLMVWTRLRILHRRPHRHLLRLLSVQQLLPTLSTVRWPACRTRNNPSRHQREPPRLAPPPSSSHPVTTHSQLLIVNPRRYRPHLILHPRSKRQTLWVVCQAPPLSHHHHLLRRMCRSPTSHLLLTTWRSMVCPCLHPQSPTSRHVLSSPILDSNSSWQRSSPTWHTILPHQRARTPVLLLHLYLTRPLSPLGLPLSTHPPLRRLKLSLGDSPLKQLQSPQVLPPSPSPCHLCPRLRSSAATFPSKSSRVSQRDIPQISPLPLCPSSTASLPKAWPCPPPPLPHRSQQLPHLWSSKL